VAGFVSIVPIVPEAPTDARLYVTNGTLPPVHVVNRKQAGAILAAVCTGRYEGLDRRARRFR
jgi:hypothetical protein